MKGLIITTGSITHAIKGRDLLRKNGFKARISKRISGKNANGCAYEIYVDSNDYSIENLLLKSGIKIVGIN